MDGPAPMSANPPSSKVAITQAQAKLGPLMAALADDGVALMAIPTIRIEPPADPAPLARAAGNLERYDWVVLTSSNAVQALAGRRCTPWPDPPRVAVVGRGTAGTVEAAGGRVDLVPPEENGAGLVAALLAEFGPAASATRVLLPLSSIARRTVPDGLRAAGVRIDEVEAYRTIHDLEGARRLLQGIADGEITVLVVTSPSSVAALAVASEVGFPLSTRAVTLVSIGSATTALLHEFGRSPEIEATAPGPEGLAAAIRDALERRTGVDG